MYKPFAAPTSGGEARGWKVVRDEMWGQKPAECDVEAQFLALVAINEAYHTLYVYDGWDVEMVERRTRLAAEYTRKKGQPNSPTSPPGHVVWMPPQPRSTDGEESESEEEATPDTMAEEDGHATRRPVNEMQPTKRRRIQTDRPSRPKKPMRRLRKHEDPSDSESDAFETSESTTRASRPTRRVASAATVPLGTRLSARLAANRLAHPVRASTGSEKAMNSQNEEANASIGWATAFPAASRDERVDNTVVGSLEEDVGEPDDEQMLLATYQKRCDDAADLRDLLRRKRRD